MLSWREGVAALWSHLSVGTTDGPLPDICYEWDTHVRCAPGQLCLQHKTIWMCSDLHRCPCRAPAADVWDAREDRHLEKYASPGGHQPQHFWAAPLVLDGKFPDPT